MCVVACVSVCGCVGRRLRCGCPVSSACEQSSELGGVADAASRPATAKWFVCEVQLCFSLRPVPISAIPSQPYRLGKHSRQRPFRLAVYISPLLNL